MLQAIHDRATGVIAWIIVFLISIPFALWGVNSYFEGGADLNVAVVNEQEISQRDFENVYRNQRQRLVERLGADVAASLDEKDLKEALLERFISEELLTQIARDGNMRASDGQVMSRITTDQSFFVDGRYDAERYKTILRMNGQNPAYYEENLRNGITLSQLTDGVTASSLSMKSETERLQALRTQVRKVEMVTYSPKDYEKPENVSDDQIRGYYEQHKAEFIAPEQVRVAYLELSAEALAGGVEVSEEALLSWYDENQDQYLTPESRNTLHILVEATEGDEGRNKADEIYQQVQAGGSFEELAKTHSADPGSASEGGNLGAVERGMMVPEFEDALFSLEPGQVSHPVKTDFGWHIIKLVSINQPEGKSFDEVRAEADRQYRRQQAEDRYFSLSETLADRSYEVPDTLDVAAEALDLTVAESGLFSREGGAGIAVHRAVVDAAFSDDVLNGGNNSVPVEIGENHVVVLRVAERVPERSLSLEEVSEDIRIRLIGDAATEKAKEMADEAVAKMKSGESSNAIADATDGRFSALDQLQRNNRAQDSELRESVFKMGKPAAGGVVVAERVELGDGTVAAVQLLSVEDSDGNADKALAQRRASVVNGQRDFTALVDRLKADASVGVFKDNL